MSEIIVRMTTNHIKVKNGEYVRDLIRCEHCKHNRDGFCLLEERQVKDDHYCSYGEEA